MTAEPEAAAIAVIEAAMAAFAIVAIRGSHVTDGQHIRFSRKFAPLELSLGLIRAHDLKRLRIPELYESSDFDVHGRIVGAGSAHRKYSGGYELFHAGIHSNNLRTKTSSFSGHEVSREGGDTEVIATRAFFDALPKAMRARPGGLTAEHDLWHSRECAGFATITDEMRRQMPPAHHPLVYRSANGCLPHIGAHAARIGELPDDEERTLLDRLMVFVTQPQSIYSRAWRQGNLVIGDDRCPLHRGTASDDLRCRRHMRRIAANEHAPEFSSTGVDRLASAAASV